MAKIKTFETFVTEMDRTEEIQDTVVKAGEPEEKDVEETEEEAEEVQEAEGVTAIGIQEPNSKMASRVPVYGMLEKCYSAVVDEAKEWAEDAHDDHTIETYMAENAALVAKLAVNTLTEMKGDMETEAFEACLNRMSEAYAKKINEMKESKDAVDAEDVE
jgi:hypothetical protein